MDRTIPSGQTPKICARPLEPEEASISVNGYRKSALRLLELFSGIGAVSAACGEIEVVGSIDISQPAASVYTANFSTPNLVREISALPDQLLADYQADVWWMSPPCQPFTRRGLQADIHDPRCQAFLRLIDAISRIQPTVVAMENVHGFESSLAFARMQEVLGDVGYRIATEKLCSSQFGVPNLRPRFFVIATRVGEPSLAPPDSTTVQPIEQFLDAPEQFSRWEGLEVSEQQLREYAHAVSIVTPSEDLSRCFTSAYGQSIVRSGSYLRVPDGIRRFSPSEVARLLGFSDEFVLPEDLTTRQLWKLLGNSLNIHCVRHVLRAVQRAVKEGAD